MASLRVSDAYPQRKRVAHQPRGATKPSTSKANVAESQAKEELAVLKQFDLMLEFGPCIGITRMERWQRAEKHGLKPPQEVKEIISRHSTEEAYTECLWNDYNVLK